MISSRLVRRLLRSPGPVRLLSTSTQPPGHIAAVRSGDLEGFLACSLLPENARDSAFAMRALNLEIGGVKDAARGNIPAARLRMAFWREFVEAAYARAALLSSSAGAPSALSSAHDSSPSALWRKTSVERHPLFDAFVAAVAQHGHTRRWIDRLIDARDADLDGPPPSTIADMQRHADYTVSSLLLLALEACGVRSGAGPASGVVDAAKRQRSEREAETAETVATLLGRAIGLITMVRALPVHARMGQRYISTDLLEKHGLQHRDFVIPAGALGNASSSSSSPLSSAGAPTQEVGRAVKATNAASAAASASSVLLYHRPSGLPLRQWYQQQYPQQETTRKDEATKKTAPPNTSSGLAAERQPTYAPKSIGGSQFEFSSPPSSAASAKPKAAGSGGGLLRMAGSPALLRQQQQQQQQQQQDQQKRPTAEEAKAEFRAFSSQQPATKQAQAPGSTPHVHSASCNHDHDHANHSAPHPRDSDSDAASASAANAAIAGPKIELPLSDIVIRRSPPSVDQGIRAVAMELIQTAERDIEAARRLVRMEGGGGQTAAAAAAAADSTCPFSLAFLPAVPANIAARQIATEGRYDVFSRGLGYWSLEGHASSSSTFGVSEEEARQLAPLIPSEAWRRGLRLALLKAAVMEKF